MKGESDKADADFAAARRLDPQGTRLFLLNTARKPEVADGVALARFEQTVRLDPRNLASVKKPPGVLSDPTPSKPREGQGTVAAATRACERTEWKDPDQIDTLAAAYAEAGDLVAAAKRSEVASATRICALGEWEDAGMLSALAAAYAEVGDFDAAIKWQARANAMFPDGREKSEGKARLKLYQARKPDRQTKP